MVPADPLCKDCRGWYNTNRAEVIAAERPLWHDAQVKLAAAAPLPKPEKLRKPTPTRPEKKYGRRR